MNHLLLDYGLVLLFLLVGVEAAGIPLPGETALVAAAVLAHDHWGIEWVIVVAAAGAIVGDNTGYWIGRVGGRKLIERFNFTRRYAERALPPSERFFARHGGKTIFLARFIALLRITAAWLAGVTRMSWWRFFLWNAAGGIVWATGVGLLAYYAGKAAGDAVGRYGLYGGAVVIALAVLVILALRVWHKRAIESA
ncbi:MAG TPA: DedA family protein [Gaiellaceae bacterium]|nr:DedA family protein [Gaiellaceae bacterium]